MPTSIAETKVNLLICLGLLAFSLKELRVLNELDHLMYLSTY